MKDRILNKIKDQIKIEYLDVINDSHLHAGHAHGGEETHFRIEIKSDDFKDKTRVQCHKIINNILKIEFEENGLHALSIKILK